MPASELAQSLTAAEQCSPGCFPDQAVELNRQILQLDPSHAAAHVRLARAYRPNESLPKRRQLVRRRCA